MDKSIRFLAHTAPWLSVLVVLAPFAHAGFFFDDIFNSVLSGEWILTGTSFYKFLVYITRFWILEQGRFFPLGVWTTYLGWWGLDSWWAVRVYQMTMATANVIVFFALIRKLSTGPRLAAMALMMLAVTIQFNPRWDGLSSFPALNQITLLFTLLAIWCALSAFDALSNGWRVWVFLSALMILAAFSTYEVGVVAWVSVAMVCLLRRRQNHRAFFWLVAALLVIIIMYAATYLSLRAQATLKYDGVILGTIGAAGRTFLAQLGSAFPLAFLSNKVMPVSLLQPWKMGALFAFFAICWLLVLVCRPETEAGSPAPRGRDQDSKILLFAVALPLLFLPAAMISSSSGYQQIVSYGDPYSVVYTQYFGAALLCALGVDALTRRYSSRGFAVLLAFVGAGLATYTVAVSEHRIETMNDKIMRPRQAMETLLHSGFMDNVPAGSSLVVDSPYLWESSYINSHLCSTFFSHHLSRPIHCLDIDSPSFEEEVKGRGGAAIFMLKRLAEEGKVHRFELRSAGMVEQARVDGRHVLQSKQVDTKPFVASRLGKGFSGWEAAGDRPFAWAVEPSADLVLWNLQPGNTAVKIRLTLQSPVAQNLTIHLRDQMLFQGRVDSATSLEIDRDVILAPGKSIVHVGADGVPMTVPQDPRKFFWQLTRVDVLASM